MKSMSPFQLGLIIFFGFAAVFAVAAFSLGWFKSSDPNVLVGNVSIWGTLPAGAMQPVINDLFGTQKSLSVSYTQKDAASFNETLAEALATGAGPDMVLLPQDLLVGNQLKLTPMTIDARTFNDAFIEEAGLYNAPGGGVYALPLFVDPLVMYWNKSIFASAGLVKPPLVWHDFFDLAKSLTIRDPATQEIVQSPFALGEYSNIPHAKDILSALFLQAGDSIIARDTTGKLAVVFNSQKSGGTALSASASALAFYTQFASSANDATYVWNRSMLNAQDMFASGKLGMYFGFASDLPTLEKQNPHLDFDVALLPQLGNGQTKTTFGRMYGLSILRASPSVGLDLKVASALVNAPTLVDIAKKYDLVPASKSFLAVKPTDDPYLPVFYNSAIISKGWLDPNPAQTGALFQNLVEATLSDPRRIEITMGGMATQLQAIIKISGI